MTKPPRKIDHRSLKGVDNKKAMLALLAERPHDTQEVADIIGYSRAYVRRRMLELAKEGHVYRQRVITLFGYTYRWHLGEEPATVPDLEQDSAPAPRQYTTRRYPAIGRRDPLVAALFGAAGARAAVTLEMEH